MNIEQRISELIREHALAHEQFTEKQLADLIRQVLASGDIIRHVVRSSGAQAVVYIPYEGREKLLSRIQHLEDLLEAQGIGHKETFEL